MSFSQAPISSTGQVGTYVPIKGADSQKISTRNIAIVIALVAAAALVVVALCYAEVKWGLLSAGLSWALANPFVSFTLTLLVVGGIVYAILHHTRKEPSKANEPSPVVENLRGPTLEDIEGRLAAAQVSFAQAREWYDDLISQEGEDQESWAQITELHDLNTAERNFIAIANELRSYGMERGVDYHPILARYGTILGRAYDFQAAGIT